MLANAETQVISKKYQTALEAGKRGKIKHFDPLLQHPTLAISFMNSSKSFQMWEDE